MALRLMKHHNLFQEKNQSDVSCVGQEGVFVLDLTSLIQSLKQTLSSFSLDKSQASLNIAIETTSSYLLFFKV